MAKVILRLKTELISAHAISGIDSIKQDLYPDTQNPFVELESNQADDVLNSGFGHVFEVSSRDEVKASKTAQDDAATAVEEPLLKLLK